MVAEALATWGRLDTLVCNAGFLRDRMLVNMTEQEWDAVVRVHLKGHFAPARHAVAHWRVRQKASGGEAPVARIVNTSSGAGLMGSIGQGNYVAAKAAIALLTVQQAAEWGRYGVLANAIAPDARTRMTAVIPNYPDPPVGSWDAKAPENVSPLVVWLGRRRLRHHGKGVRVHGRAAQRVRRMAARPGDVGGGEGHDRGRGWRFGPPLRGGRTVSGTGLWRRLRPAKKKSVTRM